MSMAAGAAVAAPIVAAAPSEGPKTEQADSTAPIMALLDGRLETEVQSLLVGADLTAVTIGQLRGQLEQRLGLGAGTLGSRKRLRRQVSRAAYEEVMRKSSRSADCERIIKALIEYEEYPAGPRQMLIASLPLAASTTGSEPHPHQVRMLEIARDAVSESRNLSQERLEAREAELSSAEEELAVDADRAASATAAEARAQSALEAATSALREADAKVEQEKEELSMREHAKRSAAKARESLIEERQAFVAAAEEEQGVLRRLVEGSCAEESEQREAFNTVSRMLTDLGVERSMLDAAAIVFAKAPAERGKFDRMTEESVKGFFSSHITALNDRIVAARKEEAESKTMALSAAGMLSAAATDAAEMGEALEVAQKAANEAREARELAEKQVAERTKGVEAKRAERQRLSDRVQDIDGTVAVVDRLLRGGAIAEVAAIPAAEEAGSTEAEAADGAAVAADVAMTEDASAPAAEAAATPAAEEAGSTEAEAADGAAVAADVAMAEDASAPAAEAAETPAAEEAGSTEAEAADGAAVAADVAMTEDASAPAAEALPATVSSARHASTPEPRSLSRSRSPRRESVSQDCAGAAAAAKGEAGVDAAVVLAATPSRRRQSLKAPAGMEAEAAANAGDDTIAGDVEMAESNAGDEVVASEPVAIAC